MLIKYLLINETLKEFYSTYSKKGTGYIWNEKAGEFIFDLFEEVVGKIEMSEEVKKPLWKQSISMFKIEYAGFLGSKEAADRIKHGIYKSKIVEYHLNLLMKEKNQSFNYTGNDLPYVIGLKGEELDEKTLQKLKEYKNNLESTIFELTPE